MSSLLVRLKPVEGECYGGYVVRLARENAFENTHAFCKAFCEISRYQNYRVPLPKIAELAGITAQETDNLWLKHNWQTGFTYKGIVMPREFIALGKQFCAQCLALGGYRIAQWNLGWMPVCLKHKTLLSVSCKFCTSSLDLFRDARCSCVSDALGQLKPVSDKVLELVQSLENGLTSNPDSKRWRQQQSKWLTDAYLQVRPYVFGRQYPKATRLPALTQYPLTPGQTAAYYDQLLGMERAA